MGSFIQAFELMLPILFQGALAFCIASIVTYIFIRTIQARRWRKYRDVHFKNDL